MDFSLASDLLEHSPDEAGGFPVDGTAVVRAGRLYLTDGRRPAIRVKDADGDLETVIRFMGA